MIRFGAIPLDLATLPGGVSPDPRLMEGLPTRFDLPALRPFPAAANLLIESNQEGRAAALGVLQASMFRLLTSLPPGQVRFTIVDPIGIGRNFGGASCTWPISTGALVDQQVWTDARQIEERLADLAAHMEKVTQKYLRNEYATIEEYNAVAGEVAEPYRVLVVADFPTRFDEKSAARLAAIAAGGVPCGVLTLIAADPSKPMPADFSLDEVRPYCDRPHLGRRTPALGRPGLRPISARRSTRPLRPSSPPGRSSRSAPRRRTPSAWRSPSISSRRPTTTGGPATAAPGSTSRSARSGATKRQHLQLGQGTSQHVLLAGRTGSGKSTLMHALITNLALNYSPDEIDLYLIDFKKGVEFKVYATHELPHASVVAIESEREFGISVLQRLDAELRRACRPVPRGGRAGHQRLSQRPRDSAPSPDPADRRRVPGVLRRGGQAGAGGGSCARPPGPAGPGVRHPCPARLAEPRRSDHAWRRSTLGQMAVRIALQCSETDAHLILSETNVGPEDALAARRGDLQRRQRRSPRATTSSRSSGSPTSAARRT